MFHQQTIEYNAAISAVIKETLKAKRMRVEDFANKIGLTRTTLSSMLGRGSSTKLWRLPTLLAAADALGIRVSDLIRAAEVTLSGRPNPLLAHYRAEKLSVEVDRLRSEVRRIMKELDSL